MQYSEVVKLKQQASQEVEEIERAPAENALKESPRQAPKQIQRIKADTYIGMGISNLIAFFIILTSAVTLHAQNMIKTQ